MVIVVGGQSRKVGKTSVVTGIIRALRAANWTAVKVTHHHRAADGWSLLREEALQGDSGRYLSAGAREAWFLRCSAAGLRDSIPALERLIRQSANTIIESNSVMDHLTPDLYLVVVDPSIRDVKESVERNLHRADAVVMVDSPAGSSGLATAAKHKACFRVARPHFASMELAAFLEEQPAYTAGKRTRIEKVSSPE